MKTAGSKEESLAMNYKLATVKKKKSSTILLVSLLFTSSFKFTCF